MLNVPSTYTDFSDLTSLRREARGEDQTRALEMAAQQFEALFTQMMLKTMRDAGGLEGLFDNEHTRLYQDMHDKQLSLHLSQSANGIGLAQVLVQQLQMSLPATDTTTAERQTFAAPLRGHTTFQRHPEPQVQVSAIALSLNPGSESVEAYPASNTFESPQQFVRAIWPYAQQAADALGVEPRAIVAQAALETGWGRAVIRHTDGRSSYNLFNIKADHRWDGDRVGKMTLEYRDGVADKEHALFRSYDSFGDSFADYVDFLQNSPRYRQALQAGSDAGLFAERLQQAGYATDPNYADKIKRIVDGVHINDTLAEMGIELNSGAA